MPNSNFLVFSEDFYIKRFSNKGYQYFLGKEPKQPTQAKATESKSNRKKRYLKLMKYNNWSKAELAMYLGVSRAWISKVLKN